MFGADDKFEIHLHGKPKEQVWQFKYLDTVDRSIKRRNQDVFSENPSCICTKARKATLSIPKRVKFFKLLPLEIRFEILASRRPDASIWKHGLCAMLVAICMMHCYFLFSGTPSGQTLFFTHLAKCSRQMNSKDNNAIAYIFSHLSNIVLWGSFMYMYIYIYIIFYNTLELFWLTLYTYTEKEALQSVV